MAAVDPLGSRGVADLKEIVQLVEDDLVKVEELFEVQCRSDVGLVGEIGRYIREGGGKRIRPALLLLACRTGRDVLLALRAACVLGTLGESHPLAGPARQSARTVGRRQSAVDQLTDADRWREPGIGGGAAPGRDRHLVERVDCRDSGVFRRSALEVRCGRRFDRDRESAWRGGRVREEIERNVSRTRAPVPCS